MKYCVYCGHQVDKNAKECPYCFEDISEEETEKMYHSNIECIKCGSKNVDYEIKRKNRRKIVYEEQIYTCKDCGKQFKDKNRLGYSFNNNPQIILNGLQKKILKNFFIICLAVLIFYGISYSKKVEKDNWVRMDCSGLPETTFAQIQTEAEDYSIGIDKTKEKYLNNSYILTVHIHEIKDGKITNIENEGNHAYSYINVNPSEIEKLSKYKEGDTIKVCGKIKKISWYFKMVTVDNATIID